MSPFQPDAASDWWNFGAAVAAAIATVVAVLAAQANSRKADRRAQRAEEDAIAARDDARADRARAEAADLRAVAAAERQAEASERMIATEEALERERRDYARQENVERKALRQAVDVSVVTFWQPGEDRRKEIIDGHAHIRMGVRNLSDAVIYDVGLHFEGPGADEDPNHDWIDYVGNRQHRTCLDGRRYMPEAHWGDQFPASVSFRDAYGDRWNLASDGSLWLIGPRMIRGVPVAVPEDSGEGQPSH